jgi:cation diffusion facilitator CzcD-associated flavoprotein CzcO
MGCKRILLSNGYYPAVAQPNVSLVTEAVKEVREDSVLTRDGTAHPVDTLIFCTGFRVTDFPFAHRVFGADGVSLASHWSGSSGRTAFRGTTTAGFPNLFVLTGPNTGLGHNSQVFMIEAQVRYVRGALAHVRRHGIDRIEVRPGVQAAYDRMVRRKMRKTVWLTGGCTSWYLDANGRNTTVWPGTTTEFRRATRQVDLAEYAVLRPPAAKTSPASPADEAAEVAA